MKSTWDNVFPSKNEYGDFYQGYIDTLESGNIIDLLTGQMHETYSLIHSLDEEQSLHRYDEEKWTVKQVIGHLIDSERVFSYRALCFCRNDANELPGFDQEDYVKAANFNERNLQNLGNEYFSQRNSNIHLFSSFSDEMLKRKGIANNYEMTVRSIPFIIAGHERHHLNILKARYGVNISQI